MTDFFFELADQLYGELRTSEKLYCFFQGERSDFVRFNQGRIRQPGHVEQAYLSLDLVDGELHAQAQIALGMQNDIDRARCAQMLEQLRSKVAALPKDPYLFYNPELTKSTVAQESVLPTAGEMTDALLELAGDADLVGILARGPMYSGFSSSEGHRNAYSTASFNLDWSLYHHADKAVKCGYAGRDWDHERLAEKMETARTQVQALATKPKSLEPGHYRVYMAPAAVMELLSMLNWGAFGLKSHRTKQTSLLRLALGEAAFDPRFTLRENTAGGTAPHFQTEGFLKPDSVTLIREGKFGDCLVSGRSAKEYGMPANGAGASEGAESMEVDPGDLAMADVLERLDTGMYINNLWYLNYSDRPACRVTGMTRFACFWVEKGQIQAPLNVMRFDESLYRAFGSNLIDLTTEREMILDSATYERRSTESYHLPGALIEDFCFNL